MAIEASNIERQLTRQGRQVEAAYRAVEKELGGRNAEKVWRQAVQGASAQLIGEMRAATPFRTGYLRTRVGARPAKVSERKRHEFFRFDFGYLRVRQFKQALGAEFGNVKISEHGALRGTFQRHQDGMVRDIADALKLHIERAASRIRQASRSG